VLTKRLIACFDVIDGRVTKARRFQDNIDVGVVAEVAAEVYGGGIDEIIFYDILASAQQRRADLKAITEVARTVFVPLTVGGGIRSVDDMHAVLDAGAEKISLDSMAVRNPGIIAQGAREFGRQCMVQSMQVKRVSVTKVIPSGYEVYIDGARLATGLDALAWAQRGEELGAGEIVVNSIDQDGTHEGYDLEITGMITATVNLPVVASGGAGTPTHVASAFTDVGVSAAIISSLLYSPRMEKTMTVSDIKAELQKAHNLSVRPCP
jgi:cyclase